MTTDPRASAPVSLPALGLLACCMLLPVTLPVPVLRGLVYERFAVSELATSLFMCVNMIGAIVAAPCAGWLADRTGAHRRGIVIALAADAVLFWLMTLELSFEAFLALRFLEGAAHITALSLLFALAAGSEEHDPKRGRRLGVLGGGLTLGVALGAPLGGVIGRDDPLMALHAGSLVLVAAMLLARVVLSPRAPTRARASLSRLVRSGHEVGALIVPLSFAFVDRFTVGFFTTTFPLHLRRSFEAEPERIGFLLALFLLPFALLSYPFGRWAERGSIVALVAGGSFAYGLLAASLGWWPIESLPWLMTALGVTSAVMFAPSIALAAQLAPPGLRGTMLGAFNAAGSLGFIAGPLVGGWVSQTVAASHGWTAGYRSAFVVAGASEILCVAATLPFLWRLRARGLVR